MRGSELAHFLRSDRQTRTAFQGVCPINKLPNRISYPCVLVVNTDLAGSPGEHWTCVYIDAFQKGVFFDSYGIGPRHPVLLAFLNYHCLSWFHSEIPIQSVFSTKCGEFCLYFLFLRARGVSLQRILSPFDRLRLDKNDIFVSDWYRERLLKPWY